MIIYNDDLRCVPSYIMNKIEESYSQIMATAAKFDKGVKIDDEETD